MFMAKQKSAKDIAFDKERAKFRSEIRKLQSEVKEKDQEIRELKQSLSEADTVLKEKENWIERLLEYMDVSEEEFQDFILKQRTLCDVINHVDGITRVFSRFGI